MSEPAHVVRITFSIPTSAASPAEHRKAFAQQVRGALFFCESVGDFSAHVLKNLLSVIVDGETP